MNTKRTFLLFITTLFTILPTAYAELPDTSSPTTFLGPVIKSRYTDKIYDQSAYSVLGELGTKNLRLGGTLGARIEDDNYMKISAEYLLQKITYAFLTGNTNEWVQQGALGAAYEYDMPSERDARFNIEGFLSYAPSKALNQDTASFFVTPTTRTSITATRRIAGSFGAGISPGVSLLLWDGGRASLALNYDRVVYDNKDNANRQSIGLGGTAGLQQLITDDINLNLSAAVRAPFNHYQAGIAFDKIPNMEGWILGIDGAYTSGKETLPNTWNVGLNADYQLDEFYEPTFIHRYQNGDVTQHASHDRLITWTGVPAVYMPEVLAVVDQSSACGVRVVLSGQSLPHITSVDNFAAQQFNTANAFVPSSGGTLIYSITNTPPMPGNSISINEKTGVVTFKGAVSQTITYSVTATDPCGSSVTAGPAVLSLLFTA